MWHLGHKCHICHIGFIEAHVASKAGSRNTRSQGESNITAGDFRRSNACSACLGDQTLTKVRRYQSAIGPPQKALTTAPAAR